MKNLKSLIQKLVKEAITDKFGEGQPIGGVKNDSEFDAGRHNVMKAVNIGEGTEGRPCDCGSGEMSYWEYDAQHIPLVRACPKCRQKKLSRYRPEILRGYDQSDVDEPIEPEDYEENVQEKIGFDGKYVDDMDKGTQIKRIEGLKEDDLPAEQQPWKEIDNGFYAVSDAYAKKLSGGKLPKAGYEKLVPAPEGFKSRNGFVWLAQTAYHSKPVWSIRDSGMWIMQGNMMVMAGKNHYQEGVDPEAKKIARQIRNKELAPYYPENFKQVPNYIRLKKKPATGEFVVYWYVNGKLDENKSYFTDDIVDAWNTFVFMKRTVDDENRKQGVKENTTANNEDEIYRQAQKIASSAFGKNVESVRPMNPTEPNVYPFIVTLLSKKKLLPGEKVYIRYSSVSNKWEKFDGIAKKYVPFLKEMTGTGAVAGYQTPFAFSKKKEGSSRAIAAAKKYGKVVKSISETEK